MPRSPATPVPAEHVGAHHLEQPDALLHPYDGRGERYMEYLVDHGDFDDLPFDRMVTELRAAYPEMVEQAAGMADDGFA